MTNVKMPNGDVVAFPDDMPKAQIRSLIEKKFPDAKRRAQAKSGEKPYMTDLEGAVTAVTNLPAQIQRSVIDDLGRMAAETVTQTIAPVVSRGMTPPAKFTPGAPVEDYLKQPAAEMYDVKGTGIAQGLPDGTVSPVNLTALIPKEITDPIARAAAEASIRQQVASAETAERIKPLDMNPDSLGGVLAVAAAGTVDMIAPVAVSLIMRNPAPFISYFTTRVLGESYGEARRQGAGIDRAQVAAGLKAAAEAATSALAGKVFLEGGKSLLGTVLKNAGVEGLTEGVVEALNVLVDVGVLEQDITLEEALHRVADNALIGTIVGGVVSGTTYPFRGKDGQPEADPQADPQVDPQVGTPPVPEDTPIEDRLGLPGPPTVLALPSPEQFKAPDLPRRQPDAPRREEPKPPTEDQIDYQAQIALQRTKQAETAELLQTARETITPLGTFSVDEIGPAAAGKVRQHRILMGRPVEAPVTIEDMARAKVPQRQIDAVIAQRRPVTSAEALTPLDIMRAADAKNIIPTDTNFAELALRTTGQRNVQRMTQAQLNALKTTLDSMPAHPAPVTVPLAEQSPFTDDQYGKALDAIRQQGRYTATAIREATGLKAAKDVDAIRDAMVRRGQLIERAKGDYRLYDTLGVERQSTPDDLPPGAFKEYTMRRVPVAKVRVTRDGKSVGTFSSAGEARAEVSKIRSKDKAATVKIEPAEETAWGVMENRYDEQGNLLGSVVVDSHRDEAAAQKALEKLNTPADTGARYTQTDVTPTLSTEPVPVRPVRDPMPPAFAGRLTEIVKRLNDQARDRKLPLLGVRVQIKPSIVTPEGEAIEGFYLRKIISLTAQNLTPDMSTDQIVERLGQVMDHELIHALRAAGVLGPESDGWKTIARYAKRAKRNGTGETYYDWAKRNYSNIPGYETNDTIEEEAIAEAFRAWASNRRNVVGKPATVLRQIVEWFKRLIDAVPQEAFKAIETGSMVAEALKPPGGQLPRAKATRQMEAAAAGISEAQKAKDENLVRVKSREYLRAREQARDDRFGKSGPKTVLGTTPAKVYSTGDVGDVAVARALADRYREQNGVQDSRLMTLLPVDPDYMKRIADAQQRAVHAPGDAAVAKAYRALIDETKAMFQSLGDLEVIAWDGAGAPYDSPASMLADIANGKLTMRLSDDMFGPGADNPGHPLNAASGYKTTDGRALTNNDIFRVVHDVYGHGQSGFRDDARGAYNAYHEHARLLSPEARRALATETLAQRAWQEFGQHLRRRDGTVPRETDVDYLPPNQKEFAEQKAFLLPEDVVAADPGWALADKAADVEETPRFSKFDDNLPGGRLYGNLERSPGGALSAPGTPTPAFTSDRPGNQFFGGELAEHQLRMARTGDRGAALVYLSPEDFLALAGNPTNPEQEVYDEAVTQGFKLSGFPSLVTSGYAGNVRAIASDSTAGAAALVGRADQIPVVLYPKDGQSLGLVTALEAPDGSRVPWPHDGRAENFPEMRGPRYSVGSEEFRRWFGGSKVVGPDGAPLVVYRGDFPNKTSFADTGGNRISGNVFFSSDPKIGRDYVRNDLRSRGPRYAIDPATLGEEDGLYRAYLALKNPLVVDAGGNSWNDVPAPQEIKDEWGDPDKTIQIDELAQWARERGHDGLIVRDVMDQYGEGDQFVAFEPTQIKSAVNNNGQYDAANPDIRYSLNAPFGTRVPNDPPRPMFNIVQQKVDGWVGRAVQNIGRSKRSLPIVGSIFDARVKLQDKMLSVKEMIEQIKDAGGDINDLNDTYMLEQLYHGKVFEEIRRVEEEFQVPFLEALKAAHDGPNKITPENFDDFAIARHATERNAYLRARGSTEPNPSGVSDAWASSTLDQFAIDGKLPELEALAALYDAGIAETTRIRVAAGLISEESAASSPYQFYAPLRGFAEEELDPGSPSESQTRARSGKGFSVGGREDRTVTGRSKKAGSVIAHAFLQQTEAVIRAQKNEVALSFMRLIQQNENLGFGKILKTAPTRRVVGANGMIHEAGDPSYRQAPDIVTAKWKGKEVIARVADPRLARAIKSDYVTSSSDLVAALNEITRKLKFPAAWNRIQAALNTGWNPIFLFTNFIRDFQTASILAEQYGVKDLGKNIRGNAFKAMGGIIEVLREGTENGEWAKTFREMQKAGGTTEFLGINDLEAQVNRIRKSVTKAGSNPTMRQVSNYLGYVGKFVGDYNKVAENAFRLAAYKAAKDAGATTSQAAYLAKNLTVNFNKGGELKPFMNGWWLFYNASIQGSAVLVNGLKSKRVRKIMAGVTAAGLAMDIINRLLSGDDDDNGITDYDDIPDYVIQNNFVLMDFLGILPRSKTGGMSYFAFPMPYGFNAFYNTGRNMSAAVSGSPAFGDTIPQRIVDRSLNSLLGFADAFNPLGGVQDFLNFIAPTIADPFVDLRITNKDFSGATIVPERPTFGVPVPDSQKYWSNTDGIPVWVAEQLNSLGGGNEVRKGAPIAGVIPTDISPEVLQHAFDYVLGGVGRLASRGFDLGFNIVTGDTEDIEISSIPLVNRFAGSVGSQANTERYYNIAKEIELVEKEIQTFGESGRLEEAQRVVDQNPVEVSLIQFFKNTQKSLQDLRRQRKVIEANDQIDASQKREVIRQIKEQQDEIMRRANTVYFEQKKAVR